MTKIFNWMVDAAFPLFMLVVFLIGLFSAGYYVVYPKSSPPEVAEKFIRDHPKGVLIIVEDGGKVYSVDVR